MQVTKRYEDLNHDFGFSPKLVQRISFRISCHAVARAQFKHEMKSLVIRIAK